MTRYTPSLHHVYNEFDKHGLLVGLPRLTGEKNAAYKQRILDVFVHRANSTYIGLIHAITRELGLSIQDCLKITPKLDSNGDTLLTMPAVIFQDTKCYLYSNYSTKTLLTTIDRFDYDEDAYDIYGLYNAIVETGYWDVTIQTGIDTTTKSMTIFNQSSVKLVPSESIVGTGAVTKLDNQNIIEGSVNISSTNLTNRVQNQVDLKKSGDYYIDYTNGIVYSIATPANGSYIRYTYNLHDFIAQSSPVIIHNLQSDDFKTKMYDQITDEDGNAQNGKPTALGADIINELLSVYPSSWGV